MTIDKKLKKLTDLARKAYKNAGLEAVQHEWEEGHVGYEVLGDVEDELMVFVRAHPLALDALEAALRVLAGDRATFVAAHDYLDLAQGVDLDARDAEWRDRLHEGHRRSRLEIAAAVKAERERVLAEVEAKPLASIETDERNLTPQWAAAPTTRGWYFARTFEPGNRYNTNEDGVAAMLYFDGYKAVFNRDYLDPGNYDRSPEFGDQKLSDYRGYQWYGPLVAP